ncbi:hypothetical protein [Myroides odoratus]|uniref:hypothetical protein n=1 Tax=Myroides odoratus TaxID=256 RepID=UPI0039AF0754
MKINSPLVLSKDFSKDLLKKLNQYIDTQQIYTLWFGSVWQSNTVQAVWIYVKDKVNLSSVFTTAYHASLYKEYQTLLFILDTEDMNYHDSIGNSLFKISLTNDRIIYANEDWTASRLLYKSLGSFITTYKDKQTFLTAYCLDFVQHRSNGSSLAFLKSFEHDLETLEIMLFGVKNSAYNFTERLLLLEKIIPKMKTLFVKRKADVYYILDDLAQDTDTDQYATWNVAFQKIQKKINRIVLEVLDEIDFKTTLIPRQRILKKEKQVSFQFKEKLLPLIETHQLEELYKFHETLYFQEKSPMKHLYVLALIKEAPSKELKKIIQTIEAQKEDVRFTIIAHTRFNIQEYAYQFSDFFKAILKPKNRVYSSDYYPQIHWHETYMIDFDDCSYHLKQPLKKVNKTINKDFLNLKSETFITSHRLFQCLSIKLQLYILYHLHYLPNTDHLNTLLNLALYAENKRTPTLNSLYGELSPLLFTYTTKKKEEKKYNLVLNQATAQQLQQLFTTIEVKEIQS